MPGLRGEMATAFYLSWAAFLGLFVLLLTARVALGRAARRVHELRERALDAGLLEQEPA